MSHGFFGLSSAKDMLDKAKREFAKMKADLNPDTIYNFFVTAYHVMDYVKTAMKVPPDAKRKDIPKPIHDLYTDEDFKMCQFACNQGKHAILRTVTPYSTFADDPLGGGVIYEIVDSPKRVEVTYLAETIIKKWEQFFSDNTIS